MKRLTLAAATTLAGIVLAATACSGSATSSAPATTALETQAATATASASTPVEAEASTSAVGGVSIKGPANNGKGDYLQTTIADDHPDMTYDPAVVEPEVTAAFSPEDIASAHRFIVRFIAEEGIDSTLNDGTDVDAWWERNKDRIAPEYQADAKSDLARGEALVNRRSWGPEAPGFAYSYTADRPRVTKRTIQTTRIWRIDSPVAANILVTTSLDYVMTLASGEPVNVKGSMQYAVRKDENTGAWLITGYKSNYEGFAANR
jgi:hypothetical protein